MRNHFVCLLATLPAAWACAGSPQSPQPAALPAMGANEAAPAGSDSHRIKLHRPVTSGYRERQATVATHKRSKTVTAGGKIARSTVDSRRVELVAIATVIEADQIGRPLESQYEIERFEARTGQGTRELLLPGRVITVRRADPPQISLDEGELSDLATESLKLVVPTESPRANDDDLWGIAEPQAVGATWPINTALAAKTLASPDLSVSPEGLFGRARLRRMVEVGQVPCMELRAELRGTRLTVPSLGPDISLEAGQVRATLAGLFPTDSDLRQLETSLSLWVELHLTRPSEAPRVAARVTVEQTKHTRYEPL